MIMKSNRKLLNTFAALMILIFSCHDAMAGKYDVLIGGYSYSAKVAGKTTSFSGFGTYEVSYLAPFKNHFEMSLGYGFTMTGVVGGDYSYGPKFGINYFPFNFSSNAKVELPNKTIDVQDFYKPYVGIAFNQRQFQSAKTSYAGMGISLGCEKYINPHYTVKVEGKMNSYTGSAQATATETNLLIGLVFGY